MLKLPLIFDGAYGTFYASLSGRSSALIEQANLNDPDLVTAMHQAYLKAGANALKTNTFGLPQMFTNYQEQAILVNKAVQQARLAYECLDQASQEKLGSKPMVFGDLGPVPAQADPSQIYLPLADLLVEAGVDGILFETLSSIDGIEKTARQIKEKNPDCVVIASIAVGTDGLTKSGLSGRQLLAALDQIPEVDAMGYNCLCGPSHMHRQMQDLPKFSKPLSFMPNAGYPSVSERRTLYDGQPDYFARHLANMVLEGAAIVGGCCGTTPEHIQALTDSLQKVQGSYKAVQAFEPSRNQAQKPNDGLSSIQNPCACPDEHAGPSHPAISRQPDLLDQRRQTGQKAILVELDPPESDHVSGFLEDASHLHSAGADLLTIADNPIGRPRADSSILACKVHRELGMEVLPHMTCRDRNLNAMKALLLGLSMEDVHQVLLVTGDPLPLESRDEVRAVFSFNSRTLASFVRSLGEQGLCRPFHTLGALDVNARNFDVQLRLAKEKEANGIEGFLTQPVFSKRALANLKRARSELSGAIYGGIMPIVSYRNACFLKNEITGMDIPDDLAQSFQNKDRAECEAISKAFCYEKMDQMKEMVDGFYLMTPFRRVSLICDLIAYAKTL